ncbi:hypothetical protein GN956_G1733 [Arapaima gigas]
MSTVGWIATYFLVVCTKTKTGGVSAIKTLLTAASHIFTSAVLNLRGHSDVINKPVWGKEQVQRSRSYLQSSLTEIPHSQCLLTAAAVHDVLGPARTEGK